MRLMKVAGVALLSAQICWATFDPTRWNFGTDWDFLNKNLTGSVANTVDYVSIWLNDPLFNTYWHGDMLKFCKSNNKTPVFYAYIIAKSSGLGDCDVGGGLCNKGAEYLKNNFNTIKGKYENYAQGAANVFGTSTPIIWLMEPDYFQYFTGNQSVRLSYGEASNYMNEMMACVKKYLPNALFSIDISPWNNDPNTYYNSFDMSKFAFAHTSGGRTEAGGDRIRYDNNNNVTWSQIRSATGKCIIADDGYGSGGGATGHDASWDDLNNIKNRIGNGVVAITQKAPKTDWGPTITSLKSSLGGNKCDCKVVMPKTSYTLTIEAGSGGKITKSPDAATYDSGTTVTLTAVPNSGYKLKSWSGDATGTNPTVTFVMTADKSVTATFVDVNAKPTYTLTVTTTGSGAVQLEPDRVDFDSGSTVTLQALIANDATFNGWGGALSGKSYVMTLVMDGNKTVTASFTGNNIVMTNLVKNGDFSDGAADWTFGAYEDAKATGAVADGGYKVTVQTSGTEGWQIQLMQEGVSLEQDKIYELTFTASSPAATSIVVNIGMAVDPYTSYVQKTVSLTAAKEKYSYTFTMRKESTTDARFEINCGKSSGTVQIDDITLKEAIELGAITPRHSGFSPTNLLVDRGERVSVLWYDHGGRLLRSISGEYGTIMRQKGYHIPGSHIAVTRIGDRQFVRRTVTVGR